MLAPVGHNIQPCITYCSSSEIHLDTCYIFICDILMRKLIKLLAKKSPHSTNSLSLAHIVLHCDEGLIFLSYINSSLTLSLFPNIFQLPDRGLTCLT